MRGKKICQCLISLHVINSESLGVSCALVAKLSPTLCNPMGCSPPGSSVHGIFCPWQDYWSGLPFSSAGDLRDPGIKLGSPGVIPLYYLFKVASGNSNMQPGLKTAMPCLLCIWHASGPQVAKFTLITDTLEWSPWWFLSQEAIYNI